MKTYADAIFILKEDLAVRKNMEYHTALLEGMELAIKVLETYEWENYPSLRRKD